MKPSGRGPRVARHAVIRPLIALDHAVANTGFRKDVFRIGWIFLDFAPDIGHVHPQNLIVPAGCRAPDFFQQEIIGQHLAGVAGQKAEDDPERSPCPVRDCARKQQ